MRYTVEELRKEDSSKLLWSIGSELIGKLSGGFTNRLAMAAVLFGMWAKKQPKSLNIILEEQSAKYPLPVEEIRTICQEFQNVIDNS